MPDSLLCDLCEKLNALDATDCDRCGSDLYRACSHCGTTVPAYRHVCPHCKHHHPRGRLGRYGAWLLKRLKSLFVRTSARRAKPEPPVQQWPVAMPEQRRE